MRINDASSEPPEWEKGLFCLESRFFSCRIRGRAGRSQHNPASAAIAAVGAGRGDGEMRGEGPGVSHPRATSTFHFTSPTSGERPRLPRAARGTAEPRAAHRSLFPPPPPTPERGFLQDMCYLLGPFAQPTSGFAFVSWQTPKIIIITTNNNSSNNSKAASQPQGADPQPHRSALDHKDRGGTSTSMVLPLTLTLQVTPPLFFFLLFFSSCSGFSLGQKKTSGFASGPGSRIGF